MFASLLALFSFVYYMIATVLLAVFSGVIALVAELAAYLFGGLLILTFEDVIFWILDAINAIVDTFDRIMTYQVW